MIPKELSELQYKKYKWFFTKSGKLVVGGKSADQNDILIKYLKSNSKHDLTISHTALPGSPFSAILSDKPSSRSDIKETAVFTASFSQQWKSLKKRAEVHIFKLSQLSKRSQKRGTWIVKPKIEKISTNLELVLTIQKNTLRAVPPQSVNEKKSLVKVLPGKAPKDSMALKLYFDLKEKFTQKEIMSALPAGGLRVIK